MIGTRDPASAIAPRIVEQARRAVPANVVKAADRAVVAAHDENGLAEELERMEITRIRNVVHVADELPARKKNELPLALEKIGVAIDPGGQAQRFVAHC